MEIILYIGLSQFIFAALVSLTNRPRKIPDWILGSWLLLMGLFMALTLLKNIYPEVIWGKIQLFPFSLTIGPFLLFYTFFIISEKPIFKPKYGLHLLPFILILLIGNLLGREIDTYFFEGNPFSFPTILFSIPIIISFGYYFFQTISMIKQHQLKILDHFSYQSEKLNLNWLKLVVYSFVITLVLTILSILVNTFSGEALINPGLFLFLGFTLFAFGFTFFGIRQPLIFDSGKQSTFSDSLEDEPEVQESEGAQPLPRYANSSLDEKTGDAYIEKLLSHLNEHKSYLERDLTLKEIALTLDIPSHHLTQAINVQLNKNFYQLINEFRVEEVKRRMLDTQYGHYTLLAIAHDSGFNSKSAFNMIFKRHTGLTPSQFKKQVKN